ncbi:hypothetical protein WMF31_23440 [Sorangium sp. So ce1036]|uniref:hypothetical protein n=1 Tax=Sorangium sp. So ce1036 TaxID=3133328 RepID=UPI003F11C777
MTGSRSHYVVALSFLMGSTLFYACGEEIYTGGLCAETDDCHSEYQNVPGTICVGGQCVCWEPGTGICCARGQEEPNCILECRPCHECGVRPAECEGIPEPPGWCDTDADCPGPPDAVCGMGRCVENRCELVIHQGPIASQIQGDCKEVHCTAGGKLVELPTILDPYDDGNQCTLDTCDNGTPRNPSFYRVACPLIGDGFCHKGQCVECYSGDPTMNECPAGYGCDHVLCVPVHCVDNQISPGETDRDCGGPCRPCATGLRCARSSDCEDGVCRAGVCRLPACDDGAKNGPETGKDCGGGCPRRCPAGEGCLTGADCESGVCWAGACQAPTCTDGIENGDELGIDCGGELCNSACPED